MRIWQVRFQVYKPMASLPIPQELVEEIQTEPSYRLPGWQRTGDSCQVVLTLSGEGRFWHAGTEYPLPPGRAFLTKNADPNIAYYYPPEGTKPWVFFWIDFVGTAVNKIVADMVARHGHIYSLPRDRGIMRRLAAYRSYRDTIQTLTPLAGAKLVMDVLADVENSVHAGAHNDTQGTLATAAQEFILRNLEKNLSVAGLAEELKVSREHLSRVFRERVGISPDKYITREKLRLACTLLRESSLSCKEIAGRVGYESPSCFTRAFSGLVGMTPSKVRESGFMPNFTNL